MATIITKFSSTASAVPTASDLVQGELAVNTADKRLFTEDSGASIIELGTNPSSITTGAITASGTVTSSSGFSGNLTGDVTGDVTGNITGNLTGNVTGDVTGSISGGTVAGSTGTFSSNVTVGGTLGVTGATTLSDNLTMSDGRLQITNSSFNLKSFEVIGSGNTTSSAVYLSADNLTTGKALEVVSAGTDASSRNLVRLANTSTLATGTTVLQIDQSSSGNALSVSGDSLFTGNITVTGNATISGNLTFGDADTDSISLNADVDSHILPNTDDTYDLGSTSKQWRNLYINGTANIDSLVADTADINGGTVDGAVIGGSSAAAGSFTTLSASGTVTGPSGTWDAGGVDIATGDTYAINSVDVLSATTLGSSVVNSSLTSLGTITSLVATTADINGGTIDGAVIGGSSAAAITGTTITGTSFVSSGNMTFGDNDKAIFGAGSDLQIYHDGSHSYVSDQGTGNLLIRGENVLLQKADGTENYLRAVPNAEVKIYYDGSEKLATTSTGIDVTGTATMDGLTVDTNTLYVDATNNRVGIGTTSPARSIHVAESVPSLRLEDTDVAGLYGEIVQLATGDLSFRSDQGNVQASTSISFSTDGTEKVRIDSSGNVGIGTTSPSDYYADNLVVSAPTEGGITIASTATSNTAYLAFADGTTGDARYRGYVQYNHNTDSMLFASSGSEAMRIDSSGNLLVGKTANSLSVEGIQANASALFSVVRDGATTQYLNRLTSDGDIIQFAKDTTTVGSIGTRNGTVYIHSPDGTNGSGLKLADGYIVACESDGSGSDADTDLGLSGTRFKDLYLSGTASVSKTRLTTNNTTYWDLRRDSSTGHFVVSDDGLGDVLTILQSNGNVGIGTSSPNAPLSIEEVNTSVYSTTSISPFSVQVRNDSATTGSIAGIRLVAENSSGSAGSWVIGSLSTSTIYENDLIFQTRSGVSSYAERLRIDSSGNVGIGVTPSAWSVGTGVLQITNAGIVGTSGASDFSNNRYYDGTNHRYLVNGYAVRYQQNTGSGYHSWLTSASGTAGGTITFTERMRLDSSGNLLVGKTAQGLANTGFETSSSGATQLTRSGAAPLTANRLTSDGDIVSFRKDGTTVGSIGNDGTSAYFNSTADGGLARAGTVYFKWSSAQFYPNVDDSYDLGILTKRFDDVYATNGTIQTSDRNEKQDIEALSDAEQRVAVACKGLLRKFRWKSAVEEKGGDARIHFGIIAQDLQAAFEAEGLDAGRYAMFIHSTWTDEETGEERSRMGVRYSELLAFIIAAI